MLINPAFNLVRLFLSCEKFLQDFIFRIFLLILLNPFNPVYSRVLMAIRPYKGILPTIGPRVYIDEAATVIGDVVIGADTSIWPMCSVRGDVNIIRIGARTNIQDGCVLHGTHEYESVPGGWAVVVGDDVTIGHQCIIHGCTVESRCLIGMGSAILDGAILRAR